jgi:hypothetical protein
MSMAHVLQIHTEIKKKVPWTALGKPYISFFSIRFSYLWSTYYLFKYAQHCSKEKKRPQHHSFTDYLKFPFPMENNYDFIKCEDSEHPWGGSTPLCLKIYKYILWPDDGLIGAETCSHSDKQIKKPAYTSCVLTVNFNPNYIVHTLVTCSELHLLNIRLRSDYQSTVSGFIHRKPGQWTHTSTHAHACACTHAHARAHTHTHTHMHDNKLRKKERNKQTNKERKKQTNKQLNAKYTTVQ